MSAPQAGGRARFAEIAFLLPAAGLLLLLPVFLNLFARETLVFGLPLEAVYLFALWAALVLGAFALARRAPPAGHDER